MWRKARPKDHDLIVKMCRELNREDPGPQFVPAAHIKRTLKEFRANPIRGKILVLDVKDRVGGYAILASFWSNEFGGEICNIDELYIHPDFRGQGYGQALIKILLAKSAFWPQKPGAVELEVSTANKRARAFYARLGFKPTKNTHMSRILRKS